MQAARNRGILSTVTQEPPAETNGADLKPLFIRIGPATHKRLKALAVERETTMQDLCSEVLERYLETQ